MCGVLLPSPEPINPLLSYSLSSMTHDVEAKAWILAMARGELSSHGSFFREKARYTQTH